MQREIPPEINDHFKIFGKDTEEVDYNSIGPCPFCGSRIDELWWKYGMRLTLPKSKS